MNEQIIRGERMHPRKECRKQEKGAITVFLALIFMSLIILAGTVIDIVRIAAADRKVQSALNSSARSVLAGYDSELVGSYGIYGINTAEEAVNDDFYRYISVNLDEYHEGISFLNIEVDREDVEMQGMNSLLSEDAFKHQIQEFMKYRTPITVAGNIAEQLKNIKLDKKVDFAKSEKVTRDKARELRTKANEVNARLAGIKKKLTDLSAEKLEDLSKDLAETLTISGIIYDDSGDSLLDEYNESKEETNAKAGDGECVGNLSEEFADIMGNSEELTPALQKFLTEVNNTLAAVKPMMKDMEDLEEELEDLKDELSDLRDKLSDLKEDEDASPERIERVEDDIDDIRDEIDDTEDEIDRLQSSIDDEISSLKAKVSGLSLDGFSLKEEAVELAGKKTDEMKDKINLMKSEIEKVLLRRLEEEWLISAEEFNSSSSLANGEDFGAMDNMAVYDSEMQEEEAERHNDTILESMEKLSKVIGQATSSAVGKINTIEYVMDKFTFLTSKTERNHYFRKGEVEYIIGGMNTGEAYDPLMNTEYCVVTKVLLEVWALRFAIDAIDNFVRSVIVFPPQRLVFALVEGALDASLDMFNMLNGDSVPICPKSFTAVKLKYSDHLKILLLLKPEEEILRKARQLMQANIKQLVDANTGAARTDFRLGDYSTIISARVEAKVNLFFLPLLKIDRLMPDSFEEGRYVLRKQIHVGY